jgi:hypothetical protein
MTTATYDSVAKDAERLTPEEQARLMAHLEDLADIRAADEAKARLASGDDELIPLDQAIAESEAAWAARDAAYSNAHNG